MISTVSPSEMSLIFMVSDSPDELSSFFSGGVSPSFMEGASPFFISGGVSPSFMEGASPSGGACIFPGPPMPDLVITVSSVIFISFVSLSSVLIVILLSPTFVTVPVNVVVLFEVVLVSDVPPVEHPVTAVAARAMATNNANAFFLITIISLSF